MSLRFGKTMEQHEALQMNALQLAYLGDSVWELIVRYILIMHKYNVHHMHKDCVSLVNAHSQKESEVVRRGRNAHAKHTAPKNQNPDEYAAATGFEALFGYLYLTGQNERISELISNITEVQKNG